MSNCLPNLSLQGYSCILFQDDIKSKEINRGALLVSYNGDKSIMIDRFDCRGHLSDLQSFGGPFNEPSLSHEEWEIEQSCNYERYYDLYHSNDCNGFKSVGSPERLEDDQDLNGHHPSRIDGDLERYKAVGFDYGCVQRQENQIMDSKDTGESTNDTPYLCPPNLVLPPGMITPVTEREAAIIEQTAKFVAEKGAQLEILIKTKQAGNTRFQFLQYEHRLHPFYRHVTQLIKSAQYVPGRRHISHLSVPDQTEPLPEQLPAHLDHQQPDRPMSLLPKFDVLSTPYGKLIERIKQSQERKKQQILDRLTGNEERVQASSETDRSICNASTAAFPTANSVSPLFETRSPSPASAELAEARHKMYEDLYQHYYPYYYQHCIDTAQTDPVESARQYAASSAAAWIQANMPDVKSPGATPTVLVDNPKESLDAIIQKMAEYVARNGTEFEQLMLARSAERFAFLLPSNENYYRYQKKLDIEIDKYRASLRTPPPEPEQVIECIVDSYGCPEDGSLSPSHGANPICFKMGSTPSGTRQTRSSDSARSTLLSPGQLGGDDDFDDGFDFTDRLQARTARTAIGHSSSALAKTGGRISRFSPANPKNAIAHLQNELQIQRKRRAAEFLASRMVQEKITKTSGDSNSSVPSEPGPHLIR